MSEFSTIGRPTPLIDGREKVTGTLNYLADVNVPNLLHARLVTSSYAHANINAINIDAASAVPGVVAVLTANDMPDVAPKDRAHLLLARDRVQFVGHPVAVIVAENEAAADDALELVEIDYDVLPAAITAEAALAHGAPLVWPQGIPKEEGEAAAHGAAVASDGPVSDAVSNIADESSYKRGDIEAGFAEADMIVEREYKMPMVHQNYLETSGVIVQPDPFTGGATIWSGTQGPYSVREKSAALLGVDETAVRVISTPMGGGFGGKFNLYNVLAVAIANAVGRTVRLVLSRSDELVTANPAPAMAFRVKIGAKSDGTLTALEADILADGGIYSAELANFSAYMLGSQYKTPNLMIRARDVLTFKQSTGAYRAPGAPQAMFALESTMNELAKSLGCDPFELRLINASESGDPRANGSPWPDMSLKQVLETLRDHPAWQNREQARAEGRGVGIAVGGWGGATGSGAATCSLDRDGFVQLHVNTPDISGASTSLALMAAEAFGVSADKVRFVTTDTASGPYGAYTGGSRTAYVMGATVAKAAEAARAQALEIASQEFEAAVEDLEIVDGAVRVKGLPSKALSLGEIAGKTMGFSARYAPVFGEGRYLTKQQSPAFCAQLAEVEVDRQTGVVHVHRIVMVQDVGRAINPMAIEGQMMGGALQGIGWALYEGLVYDDMGQLLSGSWMDYVLPDAQQTSANIETIIFENPAEHGPFGVRGVGEPPVIATAAAIGNAIADALDVRLTDLPMTAPKVMAALANRSS